MGTTLRRSTLRSRVAPLTFGVALALVAQLAGAASVDGAAPGERVGAAPQRSDATRNS